MQVGKTYRIYTVNCGRLIDTFTGTLAKVFPAGRKISDEDILNIFQLIPPAKRQDHLKMIDMHFLMGNTTGCVLTQKSLNLNNSIRQ